MSDAPAQTPPPPAAAPTWPTVGWLGLNALIYVGLAAWAFADAEGMARSVGLLLEGAGGIAEFQATYGGFLAACGVALGVAATRRVWHLPALLWCAVTYLGFGTGRLFGLTMTGGWVSTQPVIAGAEVVLTAISAILAWREMRRA